MSLSALRASFRSFTNHLAIQAYDSSQRLSAPKIVGLFGSALAGFAIYDHITTKLDNQLKKISQLTEDVDQLKFENTNLQQVVKQIQKEHEQREQETIYRRIEDPVDRYFFEAMKNLFIVKSSDEVPLDETCSRYNAYRKTSETTKLIEDMKKYRP